MSINKLKEYNFCKMYEYIDFCNKNYDKCKGCHRSTLSYMFLECYRIQFKL